MRARKYTKQISVWRSSEVADGYGGSTVTSTLLYKAWANVSTKKAYVKDEQGQNDNIVQTVFTIRNRYNAEVNQKTDYIIYNGLTYNIDSVMNQDLNNLEMIMYGSQRN